MGYPGVLRGLRSAPQTLRRAKISKGRAARAANLSAC